jgi:hypothetical protein
LDGFSCEECKKGNVLEKFNACLAQVIVKDCKNLEPCKNNSNDFLTLFTERAVNVSPFKSKGRVKEDVLFNILLPDFEVGFEQVDNEVVFKINQILQKAKFVQKDCENFVLEMKKTEVSKVLEIQKNIEEFSKRLRIILKEMNEFVPEYSAAVERVFKGFVRVVDELIDSHCERLREIEEEKMEIKKKLVEQKGLKSEIKNLKYENVIMERDFREEIEILKKNIDGYKYTIGLYRKELDLN